MFVCTGPSPISSFGQRAGHGTNRIDLEHKTVVRTSLSIYCSILLHRTNECGPEVTIRNTVDYDVP
jgi:hypothetical protein